MAAEQVEASLARVRRQRALATAWAGDLALARAELERSGQDVAARERRWKVAVDLVTLRPYAAAYALWRLAEARLARRDGRPDAATAIRQGLVLTEALGAARLGDELRSLAQRARLVVAAEADARVIVSLRSEQRPFGLTARETEVLVLLAQGLSNGEIADRLFISIKTASVHVSNIYSKLGVETRVAAATLAQGLDVGSLERPSPSAPRREVARGGQPRRRGMKAPMIISTPSTTAMSGHAWPRSKETWSRKRNQAPSTTRKMPAMAAPPPPDLARDGSAGGGAGCCG
jgi:DNA-binding CsgD family transcriptional regulator